MLNSLHAVLAFTHAESLDIATVIMPVVTQLEVVESDRSLAHVCLPLHPTSQ